MVLYMYMWSEFDLNCSRLIVTSKTVSTSDFFYAGPVSLHIRYHLMNSKANWFFWPGKKYTIKCLKRRPIRMKLLFCGKEVLLRRMSRYNVQGIARRRRRRRRRGGGWVPISLPPPATPALSSQFISWEWALGIRYWRDGCDTGQTFPPEPNQLVGAGLIIAGLIA